MTRDEILNMPAGRDMDALTALKFFGWHWENVLEGFLMPPSHHPAMLNNWAGEWDENGYPNWLPEYSKIISLAWEVLEMIQKFGWSFELTDTDMQGDYVIRIWQPRGIKKYAARAESAPLAICRAALLTTLEDE